MTRRLGNRRGPMRRVVEVTIPVPIGRDRGNVCFYKLDCGHIETRSLAKGRGVFPPPEHLRCLTCGRGE